MLPKSPSTTLLAGLVLASFAFPATAQDSPYAVRDAVFTGGPAARLPVRVIQDRLVVACDLSTSKRRIPANLFIDFESPSTLELHNQAAAGLKSEASDGSTIPITVHLPGLELSVDRRQIGDDPYLDRFTKWHSIELGETAVVGTLGGRLLSEFQVTFDLGAGELLLEPLAAEDTELDPASLSNGTEVIEADVRDGLVWLPVRLADGDSGMLALGSGSYDTTIDWNLAAESGHPAGDVGDVLLGALNLADYVALRPAEVPYLHADQAFGVTGLGLLEHHRVEIDRVNRRVLITPTVPADFPEEDLAYFEASWDDWGPREDPELLEAYLDAWPEARLAPEAAVGLVELRLLEGADDETMRRALEWADRTAPEDLRATAALDWMDLCAGFGAPRQLIVAGEIGIVSGRDDRYPEAVHEIHARVGRTQLELGENEPAWRHLLSAAFGLPEDGRVNLDLGRYYEQQAADFAAAGDVERARGRYRRAFSRFVQAAIKQDSGPAAIEALERVQVELADELQFSVDLVERMIAGKVRNFGAATRFEETTENTTGKTVLVEFFTNSFFGDETRGGAIGGGLSQEGLIQHFPEENVAFLSYHLPNPALDPLVNDLALARAGQIGVQGPNVQVIDGVGFQPGAGKWRDAEAIYSRVKAGVEKALLRESEYLLDLEAEFVRSGPGAGQIRGTLTLEGPAFDEDGDELVAVHLVLAERKVLFPGSSGVVIHRMLARADLTGNVAGVVFDSEDELLELEFSGDLDAIAIANEATLDRLIDEGAGPVRRLSIELDPRQLVLVAFVRELATGAIQEALVLEPDGIAALREASL